MSVYFPCCTEKLAVITVPNIVKVFRRCMSGRIHKIWLSVLDSNQHHPLIRQGFYHWTNRQLADPAGIEPAYYALTVRLFTVKIEANKSSISLWQLEHTKIVLSSSVFILSQDLVYPFAEIPKDFWEGSTWWNSKARLHLSYPQILHLPPLYWTAKSFNFSRRFFTAKVDFFIYTLFFPVGVA